MFEDDVGVIAAGEIAAGFLQFLGVAAGSIGFGEDAHDVAAIVEDRQLVGFGAVEGVHDLLDRHLRPEPILAVDEQRADGLLLVRLGPDRRHRRNAGVVADAVQRHHPARRPQGETAAEFLEAGRGGDGGNIGAHHPAGGQRAQPPDIMSAADGFAAQMQSPGGEGIAEGLADNDAGDDRGGEGRRRQAEIAGSLQDQERHGERSADDRHRQGPHADKRPGHGIDGESQADGVQADHHQPAHERAEVQRGEEQAAAKAGPQGHHRGEGLGADQEDERADGELLGEIDVQGPVAGRQGLGGIPGDSRKHHAAKRRTQPFWPRRQADELFGPAHHPHHQHAEQRADDTKAAKEEIV